jgi:hypothetical protein
VGLFAPWFLAGLFALGLPLWLHLLRQFKRTPLPFSSLMFFERQIQSSSKHRRLRYLTLLALRMALLGLLALLFANPFVNRASDAVTPRKLTVIAIDRSFSMRYQNRIGDAKAQATQFLNGISGSQNYQVLALDSRLATLTQPESDKSAVKDAINSIEASDETSSYGEFSRALRVMEQTGGLNLDVHLFTDAQQTSMPAAFTDLQVGPHTSLTVHEIGSGNAPNWAVESVGVRARIYGASTVRLTAGIAGWQTPDSSRKISVLLDGHNIVSKQITIPASGRTETEFDSLTIPYGAHRGEVRIEPHDDLPEDDSFLFSIERSDPRKVLFLYSGGRAAESFFYKSALDASPETGLRVQPESMGQVSDLDLSQYALVVLNNPRDLSEQATQRLTDYLTKGGSLLIAVGPATAQSGVVPIAGNQLSPTARVQGAAETVADPLLAGTFDNVQFVATPHIDTKPTERILARFADGSPLLIEQTHGEGRLLIFASTLDNSTSDFPIHASFLPFVDATSSYLSGAGINPSSMVVGGAITLRQSKNQSATADVIGPDGKHEIPLSDATRIMTFNPPREGFYEVHPASGKHLLVAAHADRRESNLTKVPADTLILWRNTSRGSAVASESGPAVTKVPFSLWRYILALVLIAAVMESIFATRYLSEERQAA